MCTLGCVMAFQPSLGRQQGRAGPDPLLLLWLFSPVCFNTSSLFSPPSLSLELLWFLITIFQVAGRDPRKDNSHHRSLQVAIAVVPGGLCPHCPCSCRCSSSRTQQRAPGTPDGIGPGYGSLPTRTAENWHWNRSEITVN